MAKEKIYKCCICHKVLTDYKPHRLVHQEYVYKPYAIYRNKHNFDFCHRCFKSFTIWIEKHNKEVKNG